MSRLVAYCRLLIALLFFFLWVLLFLDFFLRYFEGLGKGSSVDWGQAGVVILGGCSEHYDVLNTKTNLLHPVFKELLGMHDFRFIFIFVVSRTEHIVFANAPCVKLVAFGR